MDLQINMAKRLTEDVVTEIATNVEELLKFSYELLKIDVDQEHALDFLNGQVRPNELVKIILSNQWNNQKGAMVLKKNINFHIVANSHNLMIGMNKKQPEQMMSLE